MCQKEVQLKISITYIPVITHTFDFSRQAAYGSIVLWFAILTMNSYADHHQQADNVRWCDCHSEMGEYLVINVMNSKTNTCCPQWSNLVNWFSS